MANPPRNQQQQKQPPAQERHPNAPDADDDIPTAGSGQPQRQKPAQNGNGSTTPGTSLAVLERSRIEYLPALKDAYGIEPGQWKVIVEALFPSARSADAILMALAYCKARHLDIFKKPVHIVPMWSSKGGDNGRGGYIETVWPSIGEIQTTAARTGEWAGMDAPVWGDNKTEKLGGHIKRWINNVEQVRKEDVQFTFPESCTITVYRIVHGVRCPFTETVFWLEAYGRKGNTDHPNEMWLKRPHGQLHKCAKAAVLRAAFPECDFGPTAEEMEGKIIEAEAVTVATHDLKHDDIPSERPRREDYSDAEVVEDTAGAAAATGPVRESADATVGATPGKAETVPDEPENIDSETLLVDMLDQLAAVTNVEALDDLTDHFLPSIKNLTPAHTTRWTNKVIERRRQLKAAKGK
jgi:phage recombination protein Bet